MFLIRAWLAHQGEAVRRVIVERGRRAEHAGRDPKLLAPFSLSWVRLASDFDADFMEFAAACPASVVPEFAWTRVLQYAAQHDPIIGAVRVLPQTFGTQVLSTRSRTFSDVDGGETYNALAASRLVGPYSRDAVRRAEDAALEMTKYRAVRDESGAVKSYTTVGGRADTRGDTHAGTHADTRNGTRATRVPSIGSGVVVVEEDSESPLPPERRDGTRVGTVPNGNGGGEFASLSTADQAVARKLIELLRKPSRLAAEREAGDKAAAMLRDGRLSADLAEQFIASWSSNPEFVDAVLDVRRTFAMADRQRKPRGRR